MEEPQKIRVTLELVCALYYVLYGMFEMILSLTNIFSIIPAGWPRFELNTSDGLSYHIE
jgi:hypothetical protein